MVGGSVDSMRRLSGNEELLDRGPETSSQAHWGHLCNFKELSLGCDKAVSCCIVLDKSTSYMNLFEPQGYRQNRNYYPHFRDWETEVQRRKNIGFQGENLSSRPYI